MGVGGDEGDPGLHPCSFAETFLGPSRRLEGHTNGTFDIDVGTIRLSVGARPIYDGTSNVTDPTEECRACGRGRRGGIAAAPMKHSPPPAPSRGGGAGGRRWHYTCDARLLDEAAARWFAGRLYGSTTWHSCGECCQCVVRNQGGGGGGGAPQPGAGPGRRGGVGPGRREGARWQCSKQRAADHGTHRRTRRERMSPRSCGSCAAARGQTLVCP
jgi:hypothetical protein